MDLVPVEIQEALYNYTNGNVEAELEDFRTFSFAIPILSPKNALGTTEKKILI